METKTGGTIFLRAGAALLCALMAGAAPAADSPSWQVGDSWRVRRDFVLDLALDGMSLGMMDVHEEYDLTVMELATFDGTLAYRLERSNPDVTGSGTADAPSLGTVDITLGSGSTTSGEEFVRAGDYASISESFTTFLQVQTQVIFTVTIAEATLQLDTASSPPFELFDFPLEDGEEWSTSVTQTATGNFAIDFVGLLDGQFDDVSRPIDSEASFTFDWTATDEGTGEFVIQQGMLGGTVTYSEAFERVALRELPQTQQEVQSFTETTLSATLNPDPSLDFAATFEAGVVDVAGVNAAAGAMIDIYMPELGDAPQASVLADGSGNFSASFAGPTEDDTTPSNDDMGSFGVVAIERPSGDLRARSVRRTSGPSAVEGWLAY